MTRGRKVWPAWSRQHIGNKTSKVYSEYHAAYLDGKYLVWACGKEIGYIGGGVLNEPPEANVCEECLNVFKNRGRLTRNQQEDK